MSHFITLKDYSKAQIKAFLELAVEIKKDPKARAQLRGHYRQLLAQQSNQSYEGE